MTAYEQAKIRFLPIGRFRSHRASWHEIEKKYLWGTANPQHVTHRHNTSQRSLRQNYIQKWQRTKRFRWT